MAGAGSLDAWFAVTPPGVLLEQHPTLCLVTAAFVILGLASLLHSDTAPEEGRRLRVALAASIPAGLVNHALLAYLPQQETSWQAQGLLMINNRLDAYNVLLYSWLLYCSYAASSRCWFAVYRHALAEAGTAGLLAGALYLPYQLCASVFLWKTWHDDDASVRSRLWGVPCGSICWALCLSSCFTAMLRTCQENRWSSYLTIIATSLASAPLMFLSVITTTVLTGDVFCGWQGDGRGSPGRTTMWFIVLIQLFLVYRGVRAAKYIPRGLRDLLWERVCETEKAKRRRKRMGREPIQMAPPHDLELHCTVKVTKYFRSRYGREIEVGTTGNVEFMYKDGDVRIMFEGEEKGVVCQTTDFAQLQVTKKMCPRCGGSGKGLLTSCRLCRSNGTLDIIRPVPRESVSLPIGVVLYFAFFLALLAFEAPEKQVSTGLHQEWGSCDELDADIMLRYRRSFACAQFYSQSYFSIDCPSGTAPTANSKWYTICGLARDVAGSPSARTIGLKGILIFASVMSIVGLAGFMVALFSKGSSPKPVPSKAEAAKAEASKAEASKAEASTAEASKAEASKAEASKAETPEEAPEKEAEAKKDD